jgi:EAL domain-containing protein (putative c-di-GMP-specific phosphodiesterase class I)
VTSAQLTVLKEMGVDKGQGYLIAKPLTPEMFMEAAELNSARGQVKNAA